MQPLDELANRLAKIWRGGGSPLLTLVASGRVTYESNQPGFIYCAIGSFLFSYYSYPTVDSVS